MKIHQMIRPKKPANFKRAMDIEVSLGGSLVETKEDLPVGIEIEMEQAGFNFNAYFPDYLAYPESDGSLKDAGMEVITNPLYKKGLETFYDSLRRLYSNRPAILFSHRCSIHVHVDASDLPVDNLLVMVASYVCLENLFFTLVDPARKDNSYCIPLADYAPTKKDLKFESFSGDSHKYFAFNLSTLLKYNTVEFRHSEGHKDVKRLENWVNVCKEFVAFFHKCDPEKMRKRILELNSVSNYEAFINEIFRKNPFPLLDYRQLMTENVTIAKGML